MSVAAPQRPKYARLNFTDGEVIVSPRDQDLFVISAQKATEACQQAVQQDNRMAMFADELLTPLHSWCVANADRVRACYIPVATSQIQVFVVTTSRRFDFTFAEKVAEVERKFASAGWRIGVTQLPDADEDSLATFFNSDGALEVYAQG